MSKEVIVIKANPDNDNKFKLMWSLTSWCNYRCPYCIQGESDQSKWRPEQEVIETARNINKWVLARGKTEISMSLLGGEITYYNLSAILDEFRVKINELVIATNFSQSLDYFKTLYTYTKARNIRLNLLCSYHETGDEFFIKYLELLKWCIETDTELPKISFIFDNNFDFNILERFPELPLKLLNFHLKQVKINGSWTIVDLNSEVRLRYNELLQNKHKWENNKLIKKYLQKQKELNNCQEIIFRTQMIFADNEIQYFNKIKDILGANPDILHTKGRYCTAMYSGCYIDENGNVSICSTNDKPIGNINNFDFSVYNNKDFLKCDVNFCPLCHKVNIYKDLKTFLENEK